MSLRVFLADDHAVLRQGLRGLLENEEDFEIVGEADDGQTAIELAGRLRPDVIIMDVAMPHLSGIAATARIKKDLPDTKIVALSAHSSREYVRDMIKAGVSTYVLKECALEELLEAVNLVVKGRSYLSHKIAMETLADLVGDDAGESTSSQSSSLTEKEKNVLRRLANGQPAKEIAHEWGISKKTIEAMRRHIMRKLDIDNAADLTKYAIRNGLTTL